MRAGPGLGNVGPEQADLKLACRGLGHGNTHAIVLAPATPQEMLDFTMLAFELTFQYRNPVVILADGYLGQMTGKVTLPAAPSGPASRLGGLRRRGPPGNLVTSIHLGRADQEAHNLHLPAKYARMTPPSSAPTPTAARTPRCCWSPATRRRSSPAARWTRCARKGSAAGLFRPVTVWPFPIRPLLPLLERTRRIVVVEASPGQLEDELRLALSHAGAGAGIEHRARAPARGRAPVRSARLPRRCGPARKAGDGVSVFYERFDRHAHGAGLKGAQHALLPRLRPRPGAALPRRGHRRLGLQDRTVAVSPVGCGGVPLLLPRRGEHAGRPRPRPGGRARPQAREPGERGGRLPGRRRPRLHRARRDPPRRAAGRADQRGLREQRRSTA